MADDTNVIRARVDGAERWKVFKSGYSPEEQEFLDNATPTDLTNWLRNKFIQEPTKLLRAREDFRAEQNAGRSQKEENKKDEEDKKHSKKGHHRQHDLHILPYEEFEKRAREHAEAKAKEWDLNHPVTPAVQPTVGPPDPTQQDINENALRNTEAELEALHRQRIPDKNKIRDKEQELLKLEQKHKAFLAQKKKPRIAPKQSRAEIKKRVYNRAVQDYYDEAARSNLSVAQAWKNQLAKEGKVSNRLNEAVKKAELEQARAKNQKKGAKKRVLTTLAKAAVATSLLGSPQPVRQTPVPNIPSVITQAPRSIISTGARLPRPLMGGTRVSQRRGPSAANLGRKALGAPATLAKKGAQRFVSGAIAGFVGVALSIPFLITIIVVIIGGAVIGFFFFWLPTGGGPFTVPGGMTYYLQGPDRVNNGEAITYGVTLVYDQDHPPQAFPNINTIALIDNLPSSRAVKFISATGNLDPNNSDPSKVVWKTADNASTGGLTGLGNARVYSFQIVVKPLLDDITITNTIEIQ